MKSSTFARWGGRTLSASCPSSSSSTSSTATMLRRHFLCASRVGSRQRGSFTAPLLEGCRLTSTSGAASRKQPQAQSQRRQRSKRFSYADADRVYATGSNISEAAISAAHHPLDESSASFQRVIAQQQQQHELPSGAFSRICTVLQQRWQIVLLTLLRTPYIGGVLVRLLEASAYAAYVKGSVVLFTRLSVSPPITVHARAEDEPSNPNACASPSELEVIHSCHNSGSSALLRAHSLECLYIGRSDIHSRGLFTNKALPKGTRIIAEPHRSLLLAPHFLTLLADTHEKLPDTWHYTQPTGCVMELVTQAQPHHIMNHSCRANVCSGLSHTFWEAASLAARGSPASHAAQLSSRENSVRGVASALSLEERLTQWPHFADANSFFLTRDVDAGEELTLDYSKRMAPLYEGESRQGVRAQGWLLCRCGESCCRHYVYRHAPEAAAFLHRLHAQHHRRRVSRRGGVPPSPLHASSELTTDVEASGSAVDVQDPLHIAARLLELGFDDELVLLTYAARPADVVAYLYGEPLPSFSRGGAAQVGIRTERRRVSKHDLIMSYRHVFRLLNEAVPQSPDSAVKQNPLPKIKKQTEGGKQNTRLRLEHDEFRA